MKRSNTSISVSFRNENLKETYENLSIDDILKKRIDRAIERIKENPFYGRPIAKRLIPDDYKKERFNNAFWIDLSKEWRLIYSVTGLNESEILVIILDWFISHKDYERKFKY